MWEAVEDNYEVPPLGASPIIAKSRFMENKDACFLEGADLWEAMEDDYEVPPLGANPIIAQIKVNMMALLLKDKRTKNTNSTKLYMV